MCTSHDIYMLTRCAPAPPAQPISASIEPQRAIRTSSITPRASRCSDRPARATAPRGTLAPVARMAMAGRLAGGGTRISGPCLQRLFVRPVSVVCRGILGLWVVELLGVVVIWMNPALHPHAYAYTHAHLHSYSHHRRHLRRLNLLIRSCYRP